MTRSFKTILSLFFLVLVLGAVGFFLVITLTSPKTDSLTPFLLLYAAAFAFGFGLGGILGVLGRYLFGRKHSVFSEQGTLLRQSAWVGLLVSFGLYAESKNLLNLVTAFLLIITFGILEAFFLNRSKHVQTTTNQ